MTTADEYKKMTDTPREQSLISHVSGHSTFDFYRDGLLHFTTDTGFLFSVPVDELGSGTVYQLNKSITLMSWIRIQMNLNADAKWHRERAMGPVPRRPIPEHMIDGGQS